LISPVAGEFVRRPPYLRPGVAEVLGRKHAQPVIGVDGAISLTGADVHRRRSGAWIDRDRADRLGRQGFADPGERGPVILAQPDTAAGPTGVDVARRIDRDGADPSRGIELRPEKIAAEVGLLVLHRHRPDKGPEARARRAKSRVRRTRTPAHRPDGLRLHPQPLVHGLGVGTLGHAEVKAVAH